MYAIYGNIYHQYTPNVSIYTIHGSYGIQYTTLYNQGLSQNLAPTVPNPLMAIIFLKKLAQSKGQAMEPPNGSDEALETKTHVVYV